MTPGACLPCRFELESPSATPPRETRNTRNFIDEGSRRWPVDRTHGRGRTSPSQRPLKAEANRHRP